MSFLRNRFHIKKQLVKIIETDGENVVRYVVLVPRTGDRSSPAVCSIWSVGLSSVCVTLKTYECYTIFLLSSRSERAESWSSYLTLTHQCNSRPLRSLFVDHLQWFNDASFIRKMGKNSVNLKKRAEHETGGLASVSCKQFVPQRLMARTTVAILQCWYRVLNDYTGMIKEQSQLE